MNFDRHDYKIAGHFLSALINDDYTGLGDDEEKALQILTDNVYNTHGLGFWATNPAESPHFTRCEVTHLLADCINIQYLTESK
jgi:hypothetical protein